MSYQLLIKAKINHPGLSRKYLFKSFTSSSWLQFRVLAYSHWICWYCCFSFKQKRFSLKDRMKVKEKGPQFTNLLPKYLQQSGLGQVKPGARNPSWMPHSAGRSTSNWANHLPSLRNFIRELELKQSSLDLTLHSGRGCCCHRQWLNPQCPKADPSPVFYPHIIDEKIEASRQ